MRSGLAMAVLLALMFAGCAAKSAPVVVRPPVADRTIVLNDHAMRLHFANPGTAGAMPLLVYATGDGGWHRKDLATYRQLVAFGNPVVGFDARDYVTHLGQLENATTTPARLAADYERIVEQARAALGLPATYPVVLVGVSRGAGLAVVAAGERAFRGMLSGVVAVALTREEEYVKWVRRHALPGAQPREPVMVENYDYLPRLGDLPVAGSPSTHHRYLPAGKAPPPFRAPAPLRLFPGGSRAQP